MQISTDLLQNGDIIGIKYDRNQGTVQFDYNNRALGTAHQEDELS